jgi:hypothetical protein
MARGKLPVGLPCHNGGRSIPKAPVERGAGGRRTAASARVPANPSNSMAYHLAILACAQLPGGQCWQDSLHLLREMKLTHRAGGGDDADCKLDVMMYTMAITSCS